MLEDRLCLHLTRYTGSGECYRQFYCDHWLREQRGVRERENWLVALALLSLGTLATLCHRCLVTSLVTRGPHIMYTLT